MELRKACREEFAEIADFYRYVIDKTENMSENVHWIYGLHPTDAMIAGYIADGAMYLAREGGAIVAAAAMTHRQGADYHDVQWSVSLPDEEISVVHLLCVDPMRQRRGLAKDVVRALLAIAKEEGKRAVRLDAITSNGPGNKLYTALGFRFAGTQRWDTPNAGVRDFNLYEWNL